MCTFGHGGAAGIETGNQYKKIPKTMGSPPALFTLCEIAAKKFMKKWSAIDTHTQAQPLLLCSYHVLGRKGDLYYKFYAILEFRL